MREMRFTPALRLLILSMALFFLGAEGEVGCTSHVMLSCDQIRHLTLDSFVDAGLFKAAYLTKYNNVTYILRLATHIGLFQRGDLFHSFSSLFSPTEEHKSAKKREYRSFPSKRGTFRNEWDKMLNPSYCNQEHPLLFGKCDEEDLVADVVEPVISMYIIESLFSKNPSRFEWWCWPLKWVLDILDLLAFIESDRHPSIILIEPLFYYYKAEFGMSTISGTLKVAFLFPHSFLFLNHFLQSNRTSASSTSSSNRTGCSFAVRKRRVTAPCA